MSQFSKHVNQVRKFMEKQEFPVNLDIRNMPSSAILRFESTQLSTAASTLFMEARLLEKYVEANNTSTRIARAQLMIEELAEIIEAMITGDEEELLDGLADLLFVTLGTAITFNMPIEEAHEEVCKSNLTKCKRDQSKDPRIRCKGENYVPPKIKEVLEKYRNVK